MIAGQTDAQDTAGEATPDSPLLRAVRFASSLGLGVPALTLEDPNTALEIVCGLLDHVARRVIRRMPASSVHCAAL